jgi:hypothetical protein
VPLPGTELERTGVEPGGYSAAAFDDLHGRRAAQIVRRCRIFTQFGRFEQEGDCISTGDSRAASMLRHWRGK